MSTAKLDLDVLEKITLLAGSHASRNAGMCAMEAVAYVAGEPHSAHPQCASKVITAMIIRFNDRLESDAARDRWIKPLIPQIVSTRTTEKDDRTRGYMAADWVTRVRLSSALRRCGMIEEADKLSALAPITDAASARAGRSASVSAGKLVRELRDERWRALQTKYPFVAAAADAGAAGAAAVAGAAGAAAAAAVAAAAALSGGKNSVFSVALNAALAAKPGYQYSAAYEAAKEFYAEKGFGDDREYIEEMRESFVNLVERMCAVGRAD
jgi:hypothetical protein